MGISGPSTDGPAKKGVETSATDEQLEAQANSSMPLIDTTSSVGDKNIEGIQGQDGSDTEYDTDKDEPEQPVR